MNPLRGTGSRELGKMPENSPSPRSVKSDLQIKKRVGAIAKILLEHPRKLIAPNKTSWTMRAIETPKKNLKEAGKPQIKVTLESGKIKIAGRVKLIKTMNEAIIYYKITQSKDPLSAHLPKFLGVLDSAGNQIDLEHELKMLGEKGVMEKYKPAYVILGDLVSNLPEGTRLNGEVRDFKFAKSTLIGNEGEVRAHGQSAHGEVYNWVKRGFFGLSDCAFAFQKAKKSSSWYMWLINSINRLHSVKNTMNILKSQFNQMSAKELQANIESLKDLQLAVKASNFTFADSSLLFIPITKKTEDGRQVKQIDIRLIDLSHGIKHDEQIAGFDQMQQDMANSIQEVIEVMIDVQKKAIHQELPEV